MCGSTLCRNYNLVFKILYTYLLGIESIVVILLMCQHIGVWRIYAMLCMLTLYNIAVTIQITLSPCAEVMFRDFHVEDNIGLPLFPPHISLPQIIPRFHF